MNNSERQNRVNLIIDTLNSLTVEEFLKVAQVDGLRTSGGKWRGKCPIHGGDSKAFTVYQKSAGIFYNCPSSCGSGNTIKLIAKLNNLETKGRDFISVINLAAQRMGLPGLEGGELTAQQLALIEERKKRSAIVKAQKEKEELEQAVKTHRVLMHLFMSLQVSDKVVSYLQGRQLVADAADAKVLGVRSWDSRCVSDLLAHFDRETLGQVLGPADKLEEQIGKRPLLLFTFVANQCTGFQARSIDDDCEKRWRYMSRGKTACGFFGGEQLAEPGPVVIVEGMTDTIIGRRYPEFGAEFFDGEIPTVIGKPGRERLASN